MPAHTWLGVAMIRVNHTGKSMDAEDYAAQGLGNVPEVVSHVHAVRTQGMGVIAMKLAGEGAFGRDDRRRAMRFAFRNAGVERPAVRGPQLVDDLCGIKRSSLALTTRRRAAPTA
jgi:hypothetical protein